MSTISVKKGVRFDVVAPAGWMILDAIKMTCHETALDIVITSGTDGLHSGPNDPHLTGEAFDIRTKDFTREEKKYVLDTLMAWLPDDQFYGFIEDPDGPNEHIHVQRRKGTTLSVEDFLDA